MPGLPNPDYLQHPLFREAVPLVDDAARAVALGRFTETYERFAAELRKFAPPDFTVSIEPGGTELRQLQQDGITVFDLPPQVRARALQLVDREATDIRTRLSSGDDLSPGDMSRAMNRSTHPELFELIQGVLDERHATAVMSAYMGRRLRIKRLFVQINTAAQTKATYGPIGADGLPSLKTDYWHIDSSIWPAVKVIIYLSTVGLEQGPLRYIPGSHRQMDQHEALVRKTNDAIRLAPVHLLALPEQLRRSTHFGTHLTGQEPEVPGLLDREMPICGAGDIILFDNNGVHRGSFVRSGERVILQAIFEGG